MSDVFPNSPQSTAKSPQSRSQSTSGSTPEASFLERFLNSFFQEKNIRWLLLVGAAIIFGSSLMLVTRVWPEWSATMRALTVLGYTASFFGMGHFCRVRLQLNLTYRVLYGLTVLLIPICFLSLRWLSAGTAAQAGLLSAGMLIPFLAASVFLWFAARTIFDHVLRSRQTTFLVSYCLLTMAGALPEFATRSSAFVLMMVAWAVMTAGVIKVNRRVFELTLKHQLPRVFGFLPIMLLGIQFLILVGVLAVPALPVHWMGFGVVLVAATVLLTAKSLMDVFQQTTGNLVRPFPWSISAPLIVGLCLTVVGVALSFSGFSFVGPTTLAVVPTTLLAAGLMLFMNVQTGHKVFAWLGLIFLTIGYRSCPVLFADLVQSLKATTADAIRQERVPFSMYGLTAVPLVLSLVVALRVLVKKQMHGLASVVRQYVTLLMAALFVLSLFDTISLFIVSLTYVALMAVVGMILKQRQLGHLSVLAGIVAVAFAIPALNEMEYLAVSNLWTAPLLSMVAVLLALTPIPDRLFGLVKIPEWVREGLSIRESVEFPLLQTVGCVLAIGLGIHWIVAAAMTMYAPLALPMLIQFGCILTSLVVYTWRNPKYVTGMACHLLCVFAVARLVVGAGFTTAGLLNLATVAAVLSCLVAIAGLVMLSGRQILKNIFRYENRDLTANSRNWRTRVQVFVVPGFDLSFWALCSLVAVVHLPVMFMLNSSYQPQFTHAELMTLWTTPLALLTFVGATFASRDRRLVTVGVLTLPLIVTAYLPMAGVEMTFAGRMLTWLATATTAFGVGSFLAAKGRKLAGTVRTSAEYVMIGLMVVGAGLFALPFHLVATVACGMLIWSTTAESLRKRTWLGMLANVHVMIAVSVTIAEVTAVSGLSVVGPVLFALCGATMLTIRGFSGQLDSVLARAWVGVQLSAMIVLYGVCITSGSAALTAPCVFLGLLFAGIYEFQEAVAKQDRLHVQAVWAILGAGVAFLFIQTPALLSGLVLPYLMLAGCGALLLAERLIPDGSRATIFRKDLALMSQIMPTVLAVGLLFSQVLPGVTAVAHHSFILMCCAGIYGYLYTREEKLRLALPGLVLFNVSLSLLWNGLSFTGAELYMIPAGFSVLVFSRVLRNDLPPAGRTALQYVGSLLILLSPILQVLDGSWIHMLALLILSVIVIVLAIGFRVRSLVYCGTGFLLVDLLAMVIQSTSGTPALLWGIGILMGVGLIALAAYCERHREQLLSRVRLLSSELATWD